MKKIEFILDSFSGFSEKEVKEKGYHFIPLIVNVDGKDYFDGRDITMEKSVELIENSKKTTTSQPSVGELTDLLESQHKKQDTETIYISINAHMSSTFSTASAIASDFPNVHVISGKHVGGMFWDAIDTAKKAFEKSNNVQDAIKAIKELDATSVCTVIPKTLDSIIKGGRLKGISKVLLTKARLIPELKVTEEGFKRGSLKRGINNMIDYVVNKYIDNIGGKDQVDKYWWEINHTTDQSTIDIALKKLNEVGIKEVKIRPTATVVLAHTGYGAISISYWKK